MNKAKNIAIGLAAVAALAGIGLHIYMRVQASTPLPEFSFDASKAEGWKGSDNINVQAMARTTDYQGEEPIDKLPVADLTVHHGTSSTDIPSDNCFLMYSYYNRTLTDPVAAYKEYVSRKASDGKVDEFAPLEQSLTTFEGKKTYQLQQYRYVIEGQDTLQGYQVGFVPLEAGYIRVEGVCKTYEDLVLTLPVLESVELLKP